jgi:uncharacterized Fe-S center protein
MVALERASLDAIRIEDLIQVGVPSGHVMSGEGHLFEQLHGRNPFIQIDELEKLGLGCQQYELETIL